MKIEAGKRYVLMDGTVTGKLRYIKKARPWPFRCHQLGRTWDEDGHEWAFNDPRDTDISHEYVEPEQDGNITITRLTEKHSKPANPVAQLLRDAADVIDDRDGSRTYNNFKLIQALWKRRTGVDIPVTTIARMMGDLKTARSHSSRNAGLKWDRDNAIDHLGYNAIAWGLEMGLISTDEDGVSDE